MDKDGIVLEIRDVYKTFQLGEFEIHALNGINIEVRRGEFVSVMGPSGSGKSTLLNMIGAIDKPTSGEVLIDGVDISKMKEKNLTELRNKKIGFVFQFYNLIPVLTALENVELPLLMTKLKKKERKERARELLEKVGLGDRVDHLPHQLSGGQQQRVTIARSLVNNPAILLGDELTGDLDSHTGEEIMALVRQLNKEEGQTVIVVTHAMDVGRQAERIFWLRDGKIDRVEVLR